MILLQWIQFKICVCMSLELHLDNERKALYAMRRVPSPKSRKALHIHSDIRSCIRYHNLSRRPAFQMRRECPDEKAL